MMTPKECFDLFKFCIIEEERFCGDHTTPYDHLRYNREDQAYWLSQMKRAILHEATLPNAPSIARMHPMPVVPDTNP